MVYTDRLLPHSVEAEESVIGALLIDNEAFPKITGIVTAEDFYVTKNRWCFEACLALFDRSEAINQVTVAEDLVLRERLEEIGGTSYLAHLVRTVPTTVHVEHYAGIVQRTSIMRRLIRTADEIAAIGYEGDADSDAALSKAEDLLYRVRTAQSTRDFVHIRQVLDQYMEEAASLQAGGDIHLSPIATGFADLDKLLGGGLQRSDLIIVAARPSLGKSTLAFNIARYAAEQLARVAVFSLEMSAEQIGIRLVASEADVDSHRMRVGLLNSQEEQREHDAIGYLSGLPIYIDETPFQRIVEMRSKITRLHNEEPIDLLIVDYIQLIAGSSGRSENRVMDMGEISRSLKSICAGARCARSCSIAVEPRAGAASESQAAAVRPAGERQHRAGRRRGRIHLPRGQVRHARGVGQAQPQQSVSCQRRRAHSSQTPKRANRLRTPVLP